jgi:phenylacetate-CoA ligase
LVVLENDCDCSARDHPRLVHSGRTVSFFKVKGVNLNHAEIEDALYDVACVLDFRVRVADGDRLIAEVECAEGGEGVARKVVEGLFVDRFGLRAEVAIVARGTIARALETELKPQRLVDERQT